MAVIFLQFDFFALDFMLLLPRYSISDLIELIEFGSAIFHEHFDASS
jgi:hypothetical protein